ncbi:MAG TPA: hypothetical protein VG777_09185 [Thermoanaerobaculia bacterium]|nr:hypothetical protein [Thermoanaerobaculia bacterium]
MTAPCERCHEPLRLFPMGGRYYCASCFSDRRRRLTSSYRGPERRWPRSKNVVGWSRRWDDLPVPGVDSGVAAASPR